MSASPVTGSFASSSPRSGFASPTASATRSTRERSVAHRRAPPAEHRARRPWQVRRDQARALGAVVRRPRAARGRAGDGEDGARAGDRTVDRRRDDGTCAMHAGPAADRCHRVVGVRSEAARLRVPARARVRERAARRRDQPRDAEDAIGATRSDGGVPGHRRRGDARVAASVPPRRYRESDRAGRDLPAARGAARPLLPANGPRLSGRGRGAADRRGAGRRSPARAPRPRRFARRRHDTPARGAGRLRRPADPHVDRPARARDARARRRRDRQLCARLARPRPSGARVGAPRRPCVRESRGRRAPVHPGAAAPDLLHAELPRRGARSRLARRRGELPGAVLRAVAAAGPGSRVRSSGRSNGVTAQPTFPLIQHRRVIGLSFAAMRSARRGVGSDVAGSRPYRPGDDVDAIDWAASARLSTARGTDEFVVREHYADEAPRVVVFCDRRPALAATHAPLPWLDKTRVLDVTTKLVSDSAVAARSFIGYLDLGDEGEEVWWPPRTQGDLGHLLDGRPFRARRDNLERGLEQLVRQRRDLPAGTFLFVLSDFLAPPGRATWMRATSRRWDIVPVVIQDPIWVASFPDVSGLVVPYVDPDTGETRRVRLTKKETDALRAANEARFAELQTTFRTLGLDAVEISSDGPADMLAAFLAWADRRQYT